MFMKLHRRQIGTDLVYIDILLGYAERPSSSALEEEI
jgi:hypothetical protein